MYKVKIVIFSLLVLVLLVIFIFDVRIAPRHSEITGAGFISDNQSLVKKYTDAFNNSGISYKLENLEDGKLSLVWSKADFDRVEKIKREVLKIMPYSKYQICFPYQDSTDSFTLKVKNASVKYEIGSQLGDKECVYWSKEDDAKILEIEPNIAEIRQL